VRSGQQSQPGHDLPEDQIQQSYRHDRRSCTTATAVDEQFGTHTVSADRSGQQVVACTGWHPPLGGVGRDDTGARGLRGSAMRIPPRRIPTGPVGSQNEGIPWLESNSFLEGPFASGIEEVAAFMCTCVQRWGPSCCGQA
jgi:hypothetical protein